MTMIAGGACGSRGHCAKPLAAQCNILTPAGECACAGDVIQEIVRNGGPIDYGPHYSPPPTPSPGSPVIDARP